MTSISIKITILLATYLLSDILKINAQSNLLNESNKLILSTQQAKHSPWKVARSEKDVVLSYRWLEFSDTLKTREIALQFTADTHKSNIIRCLRSKKTLEEWNSGIRESNLLSNIDSMWITHIIYDIPYPFSQQDLVIKNTISEDKNITTIRVTSLPDYIAPVKDVNRQRYYLAEWTLTSINNNRTHVRFSAISFSKSSIPRFIRDPIIQHTLLSSFSKLKQVSTNQVTIAKNHF